MTAFDLAFIALLLFFAVGGLMRGLVREVFGLIAWVASIWASVRLADGFVPLVASMTDNPQARWLLASMSVGAVAYLGVILVGRVVSGALGDTLGPVNRMLGLLFGGAKAMVVIGALTFVGLQFGVTKQEWWKQSHLAPVALQACTLLDGVVDFRSLMKDGVQFEMPDAFGDSHAKAQELLDQMQKLDEVSQPQPPPEN